MRVGKRPPQNRLGHAEHCRIGADPEPQCQNRDHREPWVLPQRARGVAKILRQSFEQREAFAIPVVFFGRRDAAELEDRGSPGVTGAHAGAHFVCDVQLQVGLELGSHVPLPILLLDEAAKPEEQRAQASHERSSSGARKRAMIAVACSHSRASFATCF